MTRLCMIFSLTAFMFIFGVTSHAGLPEVAIPEVSDWVEQGIVLEAGPKGSWDFRLHGQVSPCTVIKKNETFYLYYVGADGDRTTDDGPARRALGVATSPDGIHFAKFTGNPILTHLPQNNEEEGIFSAGSTLDPNGDILIYYGAIWASNSKTESVQSNVALARSTDGLHYEDTGYVFSWNDPEVWGHGDEIFPVGAFTHMGKYHVYYIAKSPEVTWGLGLATGDSPTQFTRFVKIQDEPRDIIGSCDPIRISEKKIALFVLKDFKTNVLDVMTAPISKPGQLSSPVETYTMFPPDYRHTTIYLDRDNETWFMYQASDNEEDGNRIIVRTAPMKIVEESK